MGYCEAASSYIISYSIHAKPIIGKLWKNQQLLHQGSKLENYDEKMSTTAALCQRNLNSRTVGIVKLLLSPSSIFNSLHANDRRKNSWAQLPEKPYGRQQRWWPHITAPPMSIAKLIVHLLVFLIATCQYSSALLVVKSATTTTTAKAARFATDNLIYYNNSGNSDKNNNYNNNNNNNNSNYNNSSSFDAAITTNALAAKTDVGRANNSRGYRSGSSDFGDSAAATSSSNNTGGNAALSLGRSSMGYLDKLDNLERSVAAVLIKVAYGTTSTTKRSIPDSTYVPNLTTIATPLLTTLRYLDKSSHQQQMSQHHRNYELDLERDHALPTSAPNADILKSNNNPMYPNPNRHHNSNNNDGSPHDREKHRHLFNSTPMPSVPNVLLRHTNGGGSGGQPTIPIMYTMGGGAAGSPNGDTPSYTPPRSFFTPPLPPEYQNPFHDKPILRGTNNEDIVANTGTYINRRPIPPPSLMPGHDRIPYRPPDMAASTGGGTEEGERKNPSGSGKNVSPASGGARNESQQSETSLVSTDSERKKVLNTPSRSGHQGAASGAVTADVGNAKDQQQKQQHAEQRKEVLPSIRRIFSGSNGNKGEIPDVLLKQVTSKPVLEFHQPPASPVVIFDAADDDDYNNNNNIGINANINQRKDGEYDFTGGKMITTTKVLSDGGSENSFVSTPVISHGEAGDTTTTNTLSGSSSGHNGHVGGFVATTATNAITISSTATSISSVTSLKDATATSKGSAMSNSSVDSGSIYSTTAASAAAAAAVATWSIAWNIHVYLAAILFTILLVYSLYKMLTYNKLTHLFAQSYFVCIHMVLIVICALRIFYLCYDAYNQHATFNIFSAELLLNLPATFLTISFAILILYLFRKALNHKHNRYSALCRPLTVVVGCGVHVLLCITLHYVESYTLQHQQQLLYQQQEQQQQLQQQMLEQQQQLLLYRRQQQQQKQQTTAYHTALLQQQPEMQQQTHYQPSAYMLAAAAAASAAVSNVGGGNGLSGTTAIAPPRVLSLICQIIYILICLFLGLLYLYLYRLLKRILRSKSQNYIHGYQNLSYAIHITIATALLFVLLALLQIFGAISISTRRAALVLPSVAAASQVTPPTATTMLLTVLPMSMLDVDWLQWGYQFSLRLIEIAIITLIAWVAGLKTSGSPGGGGSGGSTVGAGAGPGAVADSAVIHHRMVTNGGGGGSYLTDPTDGQLQHYDGVGAHSVGGGLFGTAGLSKREKYYQQQQQQCHQHTHRKQHHLTELAGHHQSHQGTGGGVAGFFLPCTSSSTTTSQEQFENDDYPTVCAANTNLHTYTMRTGKLIYDDDDCFALSALNQQQQQQIMPRKPHYHGDSLPQSKKQPTYQHPYDSAAHKSGSVSGGGGEYAIADAYQGKDQRQQYVTDYISDNVSDHYENPNFDLMLRSNNNAAGSNLALGATSMTAKFGHASNASTVPLGVAAAFGQQQHLSLVGSDGYYAEPMLQATGPVAHSSTNSSSTTTNTSNYDFNTFERPKFADTGHDVNPLHQPTVTSCDNWSDAGQPLMQLVGVDGSSSNSSSANATTTSTTAADSSSLTMNNKRRCDETPTLIGNSNKKKQQQQTTLERASGYENAERRSTHSMHSYVLANNSGSALNSGNRYNSFERNYYKGAGGSTGARRTSGRHQSQPQQQQQLHHQPASQQAQQRACLMVGAGRVSLELQNSAGSSYERQLQKQKYKDSQHQQQLQLSQKKQQNQRNSCSSDEDVDLAADDDVDVIMLPSKTPHVESRPLEMI